MIARVKWCKPVSSCTRLRPNGKCFESRREGNLSRSEIHCCRNVVRWEYAIVTVAVYPLDKGGVCRSELRLVLKRVEILNVTVLL